jgi:hypothetical protein
MRKLIPPPHPGKTILEDVLRPLNMSVNQLAKDLGITAARLNDVIRGRRGVLLPIQPCGWRGIWEPHPNSGSEIERTVRPRLEAA